MKRTRTQAFGPGKGRSRKGARTGPYSAPVRAYPSSRVPLASRGYRPNSVERKVFDVATTVYPGNTTGSITSICIPTLGTDMTNRIGRKITVRSLQARGLVRTRLSESQASGVTSSMLMRIMYLVDLQPNGANPAVTDILATSIAQSPMNLNNRDRFKVLFDRMYALDPYNKNTTAGSVLCSTVNQCKTLKMYKKCNQEVVFNATNGGTVADITSGNLLQLIISNQATDGAGGPGEAAIYTRVRFTDQ